MTNPDTISFSGVTLNKGSPSGAGKDRYFFDSGKSTVVIDGQTYTAYQKISLYHEGSAVKQSNGDTHEVFDSGSRPGRKQTTKPRVTPPVATVAVTSDGGGSQGQDAIAGALAKMMALIETQGKALAKLQAGAELGVTK